MFDEEAAFTMAHREWQVTLNADFGNVSLAAERDLARRHNAIAMKSRARKWMTKNERSVTSEWTSE